MISSKERADRFKEARGNQSLKDVYEATKTKGNPVSASMISDLESYSIDRPVQYQKIVALAEHYGVNVAWLMGQDKSSPSLDENSQIVTKMTGLSPKAIENLQKITDEEEIKTLNQLLESESLRTIVTWLSLASNMIQKTNVNKVESWETKQEIESNYDDNFNVEMKLSPKESARYFLARAIQTSEDALSLLITEQWTEKVIQEVKSNGTR